MKTKFVLVPVLLALFLAIFNGFVIGDHDIAGMILNFFSYLIIVGSLTVFLYHSYLKGFPLFLALFAISYVFGHFNNLIEAYLFEVTDSSTTMKLMGEGLGFRLFISLSLWLLFPESSRPLSTRPLYKARNVFSWCWRVLVADFVYTFLYILAGFTLVTLFPQILEFYEGKVPEGLLILKAQLFFRGFIFAGTAILITQTTIMSKWRTALLTGMMLSFIGGIAPLINVNDYMPFLVRMGHLAEVGSSNFVFGFLVSFLMDTKTSTGGAGAH